MAIEITGRIEFGYSCFIWAFRPQRLSQTVYLPRAWKDDATGGSDVRGGRLVCVVIS